MSGRKPTRREFMQQSVETAAAMVIVDTLIDATSYASGKLAERIGNVNIKGTLESVAKNICYVCEHSQLDLWLNENFDDVLSLAGKKDKYVLATTPAQDNATMPKLKYFENEKALYKQVEKLEQQGKASAFAPLRG